MKYLYKLWQTENKGYDTYDSCIVCAESEEKAKMINPSGMIYGKKDEIACYGESMYWHYLWLKCWAGIQFVKVEKIGIAEEQVKLNSVLCSSFNAG